MTPDDALLVQRALEVLQRQASPAPSLTVRQVWERYAEWGSRELRNWRRSQRSHWRHLEPAFAALSVSALTPSHADDYRAARAREGISPATRNRELSSLSACLSWGVERRLIPVNPLVGMGKEREAGARSEFLDEAAFAKLAGAAPNPMARAIFVVAMDTGLRRGEIQEMRRGSLDLDARLIRLGDGDCKNGTGRIVPLTDRACEAIRELPSWSDWVFSGAHGERIGGSTINQWFRMAREKSGLSQTFVFHGLRHSCATLMRRRGVPWPLIKVALGWRTDVAARRYQSYSDDDWAALRERMNTGIELERRKPPLKSVPTKESPKTEALGMVRTEVKSAVEK